MPDTPLRVFLSSTSEDLEPFRRAAAEEIRRKRPFDCILEQMEDWGPQGKQGIRAFCEENVALCDLVVALVAWRRGSVPGPERGGDGVASYTAYEIAAAEERGIPVLVFLATDDWPLKHCDQGDDRVWVEEFRRGFDRITGRFTYDERDLATQVRVAVADELYRILAERAPEQAPEPPPVPVEPRLRTWEPPVLPAEPYPSLRPVEHPALLGGRGRDLEDLRTGLRGHNVVLGLFSTSGAGKSSLLQAGLVPALREQGVGVAYRRLPFSGPPAADLVTQLFAVPPERAGNDDAAWLLEALRIARAQSGVPPVLVLDQAEELWKGADGDREPAARRAELGRLLGATAAVVQPWSDPVGRWVLAYREEVHGRLHPWLQDVHQELRREPGNAGLGRRDLSGPEEFRPFPLRPLGQTLEGDRESAEAAFLDALERPLEARRDGGRAFDWSFAGDGARRLARAFAAKRVEPSSAPLVPELQVVLYRLMEEARERGERKLRVSGDVEELIGTALEDHLRLTLRGLGDRAQRSRALLVLRRLTATSAVVRRGLPEAAIREAIGGEDPGPLLERLKDRRVLVQIEDGDAWVLSHDRMAEVITRVVDETGGLRGEEVDPEILELRPVVALNAELYSAGASADVKAQAVDLAPEQFLRIREHRRALLWGPAEKEWWAACEARQLERREADAREARLRGKLLGGDEPWSFLESVLPKEPTVEALSLAAETLEAFFDQSPVASWADDLRVWGTAASLVDSLAARLRAHGIAEWQWVDGTREEIVGGLRALRGEPELQRERELERVSSWAEGAAEAPLWPRIEAGVYLVGSPEGVGDPDERPRHRVEITRPYRMLAVPVTKAMYAAFDPEHPGVQDPLMADHPVVGVTWYQASAFAAWLGGRLPTEAEWEIAARAGTKTAYWSGDGEEDLEEVGWYSKNSGGTTHRVAELPVNPWGLYDVHGNVWEWTADWFDSSEYARRVEGEGEPVVDPQGPPRGGDRVIRGGSYGHGAGNARSAYRGLGDPGNGGVLLGFRVLLPAAPSED